MDISAGAIHAPIPNDQRSYRIQGIDILRGLVMVIMALDHTRDFFHIQANTCNPLDLSTTTPALFATRWVTHFCAPVFVFLSGVSIYLQSLRKTRALLSKFLLTRGLWLIFVELVIVSFGITFSISWAVVVLQVIWAIGISMVLMSLIIHLPFRLILVLGLIIVLGHNSLDYYEAANPNSGFFYNLLHRPTFSPLAGSRGIGIFYPFLPWLGVMMVGYCFGQLYSGSTNRPKLAYLTGAILIVFFIVLRATNSYGDNLPWSKQPSALYTFFSFINVQKYPPSVLYLCATIGPAMLLLGAVDKANNWFTRVLTVYGRVPFLYYILHFYILHIITAIFFLSRGHSFSEGIKGTPNFPINFVKPGEGFTLGGTYIVWICVVIALYPVCKWFSEYKKRSKKVWLSYL